ncbi:MAG: efflux RND transporter periplasmic adaptor subunit [Candidatus Omnitrophota bacterium]
MSRDEKKGILGAVKGFVGRIKKNYIWTLLGILVVTFVLARSIGTIKQIFFKTDKDEKRMGESFVESIPVKVYKIKRMDFQDTLPAMGRIEGLKEIELRFDSKGVLESFNFEEGERILEGDIIASLEQKDALLKLKYAALEMEKNSKLFELGGVDKMAVDQKKLEYESSKRELEKTNIYAPSDGYLGSKEKNAGTFITSQDKIGMFVDFKEVYASFDIIEEDSSKIKLGQNVEIFMDAYPGKEYTGTVDTVAPMIEGRTRTQKIKIELENKDDALKPGMFARAIINTYESKDALVVPASSFRKEENKYYVYVVHPEGDEENIEEYDEEGNLIEKEEEGKEEEQEDTIEADEKMGTVEKREIAIEYLTHDIAEISKGLEEGEFIIRELHREYKDGDKVEITEVQETIF